MDCEAEAYNKFKPLSNFFSHTKHANRLEDQEEEQEEEDRNQKIMAESGSSENGNDGKLCANKCGFYGTPKNRNLCSVCYAASLKEIHVEESDLGTRDQSSSPSTSESSTNSETCESKVEAEVGLKNRAAAKTKSRCRMCKKKVGLLGFNCRCGGLFCGGHRYPEEHSCGVDRKAIGRETLAKQLVECKADKLEFRV